LKELYEELPIAAMRAAAAPRKVGAKNRLLFINIRHRHGKESGLTPIKG